MAGAKFEYDEHGTTFHCFVLTFMALIVTPATCLFWPVSSSDCEDTEKEDVDFNSGGQTLSKKGKPKKRCRCEACFRKRAYIRSKDSGRQLKQRLM